MALRKFQTIRNPAAYEKSQRAKRKKHQAQVARVADRLTAIIRDKHDGEMDAPGGLHQAWIILTEGGALRPNDGRHGDCDRQTLVREALEYAVASGQIQRVTADAGEIILSLPRNITPVSPEVTRLAILERYEDALPRMAGYHFNKLRLWGEAA